MKRILLFKALLLLTIFNVRAQPFQQSFTNAFGYSCDHYSIETFSEGGPASYAAAGTFFNGAQTIMHIFTLDQFGLIVWENYVNLGATDARALDVTIGSDYQVAITGFLDFGGGPELYAALYDMAGSLVNDFQFTGGINTSGSNIIYSRTNDQYIIGGFESSGGLAGSALLIALDGGFNYQWSTNYDAQCDGFDMAVINEIVEVNEHYFITGNFSGASAPYPNGQSQVLAAMVENSSGAIIDNESFVATNTLGGQQAMGISAHFNEGNSTLVLMYNVSVSPTVDENRPYITVYEVSGVDLNYAYSYRIDDTFGANPSPFVNNPNWTGLKLLYNRSADTYLIFGMIEAYGGLDDRVLSVYQEIDLNSGGLVAAGKLWTQSDIATGYLAQGGFYALFDDATLSTEVYTPETATLNVDGENFVNIVPVPGSSISYDVFSSALNTAYASSACIEEFKPDLVPHDIYSNLCLNVNTAAGTIGNPLYGESATSSTQNTTCIVNMSPSLENPEFVEGSSIKNELSLIANPAQDILRFTIAETGTYSLKVISMEGQLLISNEIENIAGQNEINIDHLAAGIYLLVAVDSDGQTLQKQFVKK